MFSSFQAQETLKSCRTTIFCWNGSKDSGGSDEYFCTQPAEYPEAATPSDQPIFTTWGLLYAMMQPAVLRFLYTTFSWTPRVARGLEVSSLETLHTSKSAMKGFYFLIYIFFFSLYCYLGILLPFLLKWQDCTLPKLFLQNTLFI